MIGQTVSHYRITRKLGAGGMGVVYEAVDTKLDRPVALKFLPPESTRDSAAKARFIHEAKAASALDHPNICNIHEINTTDDGHLFIVMARYEGETLQDRIARGPLPMDEAVDITRQVAEGLAKAHEREIVHRDIKPANIFITSDGLVKILDFGLAKLTTQSLLTKTGTTLGTVSYLSPEQALGGATDQRTDLWCLGVVFYEMVTGKLPFVADHEQAIIYSILNMEPPSVRSLRPEVPGDLELVIFKCLAKDPNERYRVPADLLQDLEQMGTSLDTSDRPPPRTISLASGGRRKRARLRWLVPAILVMVVGMASWVFLRGGGDRTGPSGPSLAVIDFRDLVTPDDLFTSTFLMGLLNTGLIENSPARVISSEYLHELKGRLFGANQGLMGPGQALQVAREAGATLLLTGQIALVDNRQILTWRLVDAVDGSNLIADRMEDSNLIDLADKLIAASIANIQKTLGIESSGQPVSVAQIFTSSPEAYGHYLAGVKAVEGFRGEDAIRELHRAVEIDSTFALPYLTLCQYWYYRSAEKTEENWNKAWQLRERLGVQDLMRLEMIKERSKSPVDFHHVLRLYEEMLSRWPDDRGLLRDLKMITGVEQGNHLKANEYGKIGLAYYPDDLNFLLNASSGRRTVGDFEGSLSAARVFVAKHPREPNAWDELGLAFLGVAMPDSAERAFRQALEIKPDFWFGNRHLATQYYCRGDNPAAIETYLTWLSENDWPLSDEDYTSYSDRPTLVKFYQDSGQVEKARDLFRASLEDSSHSKAEYGYIRLLLSLGEPEEALSRLRSLGRKWPQHHMELEGWVFVAIDSLVQAEAIVETFNEMFERNGSYRVRKDCLKLQVQISLAKGEPEEALRLLGEIRAFGVGFPGLDDIELRATRAQALRQAGQPEEAAKVLHELLRLYAGHAQAHYELGKVYEVMGRVADAELHYEKFLAMWQQADEGLPQLEDTRLRLAALKSSK